MSCADAQRLMHTSIKVKKAILVGKNTVSLSDVEIITVEEFDTHWLSWTSFSEPSSHLQKISRYWAFYCLNGECYFIILYKIDYFTFK